MPTGHDPTRVYKSSIPPQNGQKLGALATWTKLKYQSHQLIDNKNNNKDDKIVEFGYNGEIFIFYKSSNIVEVWDWKPSALELNQLENNPPTNDHHLLNQLTVNDHTLYLVASALDLKGNIININPIICDQISNTYTILITSIIQNETTFKLKKFGQVFQNDAKENSLVLPPSVYGLTPFTIKNSETFIGIATNEGSLTIFDINKNHPLSLTLDCEMINDHVLFSISGRYLAYVPNLDSKSIDLTTTKLIPKLNEDSIYFKILNNLSKSTIDGITKMQNINNINLKHLSNLLNNAAILGNSRSQYIIIIDLVKAKQIGCFQPSDGISQLSLSPFNSQLITVSKRGDQISNWDLTKLPIEISLLDVQIRGKTSSIVDYINWSNHNKYQIITRSSGSIHNLSNEEQSSWILPNMNVEKISQISSHDSSQWLLGVSNSNQSIYLIDSLTGSTRHKFDLPKSGIPKSLLPNYIKLGYITEKCLHIDEVESLDNSPISQIEIESSYITSPLYQSKQITMGNYSFSSTPPEFLDSRNGIIQMDTQDDFNNFRKIYGIFGNSIGFKQIDELVKRNGEVELNHDGLNGLNEALNDNLTLNR